MSCNKINCDIATNFVTLVDGDVVCNACPAWALECEARRLLTYKPSERRESIQKRKEIRKDISELERVMRRISEQ